MMTHIFENKTGEKLLQPGGSEAIMAISKLKRIKLQF
jgi:hypothetical protein